MKRSKPTSKYLLIAYMVLLLVVQTIPGLAQGKIITGNGTISGSVLPFSPGLSLSFPPAGGPVSGTINGQQPFINGSETCTQSLTGSTTGDFAGGDGGAVAGTLQITFQVSCSAGSNTQNYNGDWQGTLNADGTGSGIWSSVYGGGDWQISYSAADFSSAITPVELDYVYFEKTYGLNIQDGDQPWKQEELQLLDEALREVPKQLLDRLPVRSIERYAAAWDKNWNLLPSTMGQYSWAPSPDRPSQLQMYDSAFNPSFYNDETGRTKFKATFIHELTHSLQESDPNGGIIQAYKNPRMDWFKNAIRPDINPDKPDLLYGWYWNVNGSKKWKYYASNETTSDLPPYRPGENKSYAPYSRTNPLEDMSVSVEMYMFDPDSLKAQSPKRYEFIRTNIFQGVEYENGIQKP